MAFSFKKLFGSKKSKSNKAVERRKLSAVPEEAKRAACSILLEVASIDGEFEQLELKELAKAFQTRFELPDGELFDILTLANEDLKHADDIGQFTDCINKHFSQEEKYDLMVLLWQVIFADGILAKQEERFAKQIMNRLDLPQVLALKARDEAAESSHAWKS